ncbi:MAG: V-type ATPase subunit, partial [Clostridia bacterium]
YDYLNAKILMKSKYLRLESLELCYTVGLIDAKTLAEYINVDEYNLLPTRMKEACEKIDIEFYEGKRNPKVVDITLDKAMFADILEMSSKCGVNSVKEYFQCVVDTTNILTMLRAKRAGIEADSFEEMFIVGATLKKEFVLSVYSEPFDKWINMFEDSPYARFAQCGVDGVNKGSLFECERLAEQYKRSILTPHNFELTVEPLVCYYLSKLAEIENVRMCLICIKNNFSAEQIKERIKSLYV